MSSLKVLHDCDFICEEKRLLDYANLFFSNDSEEKIKIIFNSFNGKYHKRKHKSR